MALFPRERKSNQLWDRCVCAMCISSQRAEGDEAELHSCAVARAGSLRP